jgi:hypothetical protein
MIFFLIWALYLLHSKKWKLAAVVFACSVSIKLIPLLFLPLFYKWFTKKETSTKSNKIKLLAFYAIIGATTMLLFLPFYTSQFLNNYAETVGLWFQNFEFNASLYYVAREIGYSFTGYNEIAIIGTITAIVVFLFVVAMALYRRNSSITQLITAMLFALSFYYFTATTVHPWYIATLLILSIFTKYKFPFVWSFVIILSYLAYLQIGNASKSENLLIIAIEYAFVYGIFIYELWLIHKLRIKTGTP